MRETDGETGTDLLFDLWGWVLYGVGTNRYKVRTS